MSMNRWLIAAVAAAALLPAGAAAQQRGTIQGTIADATTGRPLAGAQVQVVGSALGSLTNAEGRFQIVNVPTGQQTIRAQLIGYGATQQAVSVTAGAVATVNFTLEPAAVSLEGVVVTALGLEQQQRAVGTSVQAVSGADIAEAREANIVNALSGKVSGVAITNAGPQGGSSRIVIRGASSIAGNNQPLFIVDGVPVDNSSPDLSGYGGIDYGNAAQDINPNDIESISVLKGPNAAALYGSRAANGAIVITTKSGRGTNGSSMTVTQNVTFEDPLRLPDYQNEYGQGSGGEFAYVDGNYGGVNDGTDESWGPKLDGRMIPQYNSPVVNGVVQPTPWVASPDNVKNFFDTGRTSTTNVALASAGERSNVRLSLTRMDQDGMYPSFGLERTTVALNGGASLTDRLTGSAAVQYIAASGENRPGTGYGGDNPMQQFIWFGRQVDMDDLHKRRCTAEDTTAACAAAGEGNMHNWNYSYHNNPYWLARENRNWDDRNRIIGNVSASYKLTDWLNATVRSGTDWYEDNRKSTYAAGTIGIGYVGGNGAFIEDQTFFQETNTDFLLSADRDLTSDISLSVNAGGNRRENTRRSNDTYVQNLSAPGIYSLSNAAVTPVVSDFVARKQVNSLYGQAQFGFRNYFFVDVTGRNDWSSTLPESNNSYFYPSVSSSFVFTDVLPTSDVLSYGKVRASWARVGNDADPYQLASTFSAGTPFAGFPTFGVNNTIPNASLKPESTDSWEVGTELSFLDNRLGLDFTYYNQSTTNQILGVQISPTTGYTNQVLNAGEVTNRGVELLATATPVQLDNGFQWDVTANFAKNNSEVAELYGDLETLVLGTYWSLTVEARKGEPYGALYGFGYVRDSQGNIVVGANGRPLRSSSKRVLGNYNPDWIGGLSNSFRYRGFDFSFLVDTKQGGEVFSVTNMFGRYAGVLEETLEGREGGLVVEGVMVNAAGDTVPNTTNVSAESYNHGLYGLHEAHVFDASFVKLREMKLGYTLPSSLTDRMGVSGLHVSLIGRNLWLNTNTPHIDPETAFDATNAQGLEFGQLPSARSIGLNVVVTP
jgi:TonB-linked SusC/RagA family outer membrane protein